MAKWFYIPKLKVSEEEGEFRLNSMIPKPVQESAESREMRIIKEDIEYATECARKGETAWANSFHISIQRKAERDDCYDAIEDGLCKLSNAIDEAMTRRYATGRKAPKVQSNDDRSEKPDYCGWEEAAEACGCK